MQYLYQDVQQRVTEWRSASYPCDDYPAIAEILNYATIGDDNGTEPHLRFLRAPQLQALETYWYLRLVERTPHIFDLYRKYYSGTTDLLQALGMGSHAISDFIIDHGQNALWQKVRQGGKFVKRHKLEAVHETITLDYPSYILALAMGAGKTMLIGAIVATEFALALEYHPAGDGPFIQNALVFAPGLTILESLRELIDVPYDQILPPRLFKGFDATYKITFTQDGQKDLPLIRGSRYNLVVSNTEKIRIQKRSYRHHTWSQLYFEWMQEQYEAEANLRLQAIASLPNLGIFSDEAHHTYGQDVTKDLKRVRQTVDYLHENTNLICVVNTTGTPYYGRQPLRDVVIWYGLAQGIEDNILKSLDNSIYAYDYPESEQFVAEVVSDFFQDYGDVSLPNGAPAKLAIYFPQNKDLDQLRPVVEQTLVQMGRPLDIVLRNTEQSTQAEIDAFNRLNDPASRHRVILLVNKGTEGWNCPSLFACALARTLTSSNNFVLQASTRCLRQVPGNRHKARIYLSMENRGILDRQLQETYGETIERLRGAQQQTTSRTLRLRKMDIPPLVVRRMVQRVVALETPGGPQAALDLQKPEVATEQEAVRQVFTPAAGALQQVAEKDVMYDTRGYDPYIAAARLSATYRLDAMLLLRQLRRLYPQGVVPDTHLPALAAQVEQQTQRYTVEEEEVEVALALVRPEGFAREETEEGVVYTTEITYPVDKEHLLLSWQEMLGQNEGDFGFHYDPYQFDSSPEKDFFRQMLHFLNETPEQVQDIYFTGGLSDPDKTDFYVEYRNEQGGWSRYHPDFVVRRKDDTAYIVEIKDARLRQHEIDGEKGRKAMAIKSWVDLSPERLKYQIIFTGGEGIAFNKFNPLRRFIEEHTDNE